METFVPINEFLKKDWSMHQTREQWVATLQNLDSDNITWKAPDSVENPSFTYVEISYGFHCSGYGVLLVIPIYWC